jgi:hypothetical protein
VIPIFDNTPFGVGDVEERLDLKGAQIAWQGAPPQAASPDLYAMPKATGRNKKLMFSREVICRETSL